MTFSILMYLTFFLFSLGQLGRISFFGSPINFYLYEIPLVAGLFYLLYRHKFIPLQLAFKKWREMTLFLGVMALSYIFNFRNYAPAENFIALLYLLRLVAYCISFLYLLHEGTADRKSVKVIQNSLLVFLWLTVFSSLTQYVFYPNLRNLSYLGWDPHQYRLFGLFFDTSTAGALFGLVFIYLLTAVRSKNTLTHKIFVISFFIFVLLTFSRGLYLSLAIVFLMYFIIKREFVKVLVFLTVLVLGIVLIPKPFGEGVRLVRMVSVESRLRDYQEAVQIWSKHPVLGVGYNHIRSFKNQSLSHSGASFASSYLIILVSAGVVGLFFFLAMLWELGRSVGLGRYLILFVSLLSLTDNIFLHPFVLFLLLQMMVVSAINPSGKSR